MIGLCRANCLWATSFFRRCIIPATHCQANRGINAVGLRKLTKYCDSFRFLELFCVYFYWDGTYRPICIAPHRFYSTYIIPHFGRFFNTSGLISLICTIIHETFLTIRHTLFLIIIFVSFSYNFRFCLSTIYQSGARLSYKPPFHSLHRNSFLFRQNPADMLPLCRHLYRISLPSALRLYLPP